MTGIGEGRQWANSPDDRIKEAIAFAKPYNPDAFLAVGEFAHGNCQVERVSI